jgi:hypothetical protein
MFLLAIALAALAASLLRLRLLRRPPRAWPLLRASVLMAAPGASLLGLAHQVGGSSPTTNVLASVTTAFTLLAVLSQAVAARTRVAPLDRAIRDLKDPRRRADAATEIVRFMKLHQPQGGVRDTIHAGNALLAASELNKAGLPRDADAVLSALPSWAMDDAQLLVRDFNVLFGRMMLVDHARARKLLAAFRRPTGNAYMDLMARLFEALLLVVDGAHREALAIVEETACGDDPTANALALALRAHVSAASDDEHVTRALLAGLASKYVTSTEVAPDLLRHPLYFWDGGPATQLAHQLATGAPGDAYR